MHIRRFLIGILLLSLFVRIAAMILLETWKFPTERDFGFEEGEIAFALANGQGFSWPQTWRPVGPPGAYRLREHPEPTTWKAPINPAITAAAFLTFGPYTKGAAVVLELFQVLLSVLTSYVLFRLGQRVFNDWAGLVAALWFALYPSSIHFAVQKIEYGTLLTFLGVCLVYQTLALSDKPQAGRAALLGVLAGVTVLVNPVILAFCPFGLLWFLGSRSAEWLERLKLSLVILGCCAVTITPWLVRNYMVFHQFVFIKSNFARELVISNYREESRTLSAQNPTATEGNDAQISSLFNQKAMVLLVEKPMQFVRKASERFPQFWRNLGDSKGTTRLVVGANYYLALVLGIAGMCTVAARAQARLLILYVMTMPIPFYLTWGRMVRFRFPIEPVFILFASYFLVSVVLRSHAARRLRRTTQR